MPRLSLWRQNHTNDYKFFDRNIFEMFTVGGTDINIHKYLGPAETAGSQDATKPDLLNQSAKNIQDLLFLENRDRIYDTSVYSMRGIYRVNDNDFDLSQFGLFLTSDTLFIVFHTNDMVEKLGRKIIVGDVLELPHLKDYYPLNDDLPTALKRFYVVQDATRGAEGFSPTWWSHLWRVKVQPLVDSQEYKDILNSLDPAGGTDTSTNGTLGELLSTYNTYININDVVVSQAENDVPESGYDVSSIYVEPDYTNPNGNYGMNITGYLSGDGLPPNGVTSSSGISFPMNPSSGEYFLRVDFLPNRLFQYDGKRWVKVEDAVRTSLTPGPNNKTQLSKFVNNENITMSNRIGFGIIRCSDPYTPHANTSVLSFNMSTKTVITKINYSPTYFLQTKLNGLDVTSNISNISGNIGFTISSTTLHTNDMIEYEIYSKGVNERQSLSKALRPKADN